MANPELRYTTAPLQVLTQGWWMMVVRGIAAILAGVVAIAMPGTSLTALVLLFGAYATVNGGFAMLHALRGSRGGTTPWGWLAFEGIVSIGAGVLAVIYPGLTLVALVALVDAWALATGIAQIVSAFRLRRVIRNEWLLSASGTLATVFAVLLFVLPVTGSITFSWIFGAYLLLFAVLLIALGLRLHNVQGPVAGATAA